MALLTIPATPEKGILQTYSLNVTDLIALISDPYFQQQTNWSRVIVMYQSSVSNQIENITFIPDGVSTSLNADAEFSLKARDVFNLHSIMIVDDQNGRNITYAASIPDVANYTIDLAAAPPSSFEWDLLQGNASTSGGGQLQNNGGGTSWLNAGYYNVGLLGDFTFTCVLDYSDPSDTMVGYAKTAPTIGGEFISIAYRAAYFHSILTGWQEGINTGVIAGWEGLAVYTCEIKRVSGVLTVKVNGNDGLTENYTGPVYLGATIYQGAATANVISATLVETPAPALYSHDFASGEQSGQIDVGNSSLVSGKMLMIPTPSVFAGFETTITSFPIPNYPSPSDLHNVRLYFSDFVGSAFLSAVRVGSRSYGFINVTTITGQNIIDGYIDFVDVQFGNFGGDRNFIIEIYNAGSPSDTVSIKISKVEIF